MLPLEKNARQVVATLAQYFPNGGLCEDIRRRFELDTRLRPASFYNALRYAKERAWLVGGGSPRDLYQLYYLNPNGSWREPMSTIEGLEKLDRQRLEYLVDSKTQRVAELENEVQQLRDLTDGADGMDASLNSLIRIVSDNEASPRQRIRASAAVLNYKTGNDQVTEFAKRYLERLCTSDDVGIDDRIDASELLRRHEAPKISPAVERPTYRREDEVDPEVARAERQARFERKVEHMERMTAQNAKELAEELARSGLQLAPDGSTVVPLSTSREGGSGDRIA